MKTTLPPSIKTIEEAQAFLTQMEANGESYHPEDDAHEIIGQNGKELFTSAEAETLNALMDEISELKGFDACEFILNLDEDYRNNQASYIETCGKLNLPND